MFASNTSTLVLLAKVSCLEHFIEISPKIEIPNEVKKEALFHEHSYYAMLINKLIQEKKIIVYDIKSNEIEKIMKEFKIDRGEAATYIMYDKKKHKAILTDDGELIKLCKLQRIPFINALAVIIRLYDKKIISKEKALEKLKKLNEIGRYSNEIYEYFKKEIK